MYGLLQLSDRKCWDCLATIESISWVPVLWDGVYVLECVALSCSSTDGGDRVDHYDHVTPVGKRRVVCGIGTSVLYVMV
jgi:hypothetical protein